MKKGPRNSDKKALAKQAAMITDQIIKRAQRQSRRPVSNSPTAMWEECFDRSGVTKEDIEWFQAYIQLPRESEEVLRARAVAITGRILAGLQTRGRRSKG